MTDRRTKIVATLGPATEGEQNIGRLLSAGMNAARLNFSHGNHEVHARAIAAVRAGAAAEQRPVAIIADLQGPKIRVGEMPEAGIRVVRGQELRLTPRRVTGEDGLIPVSFPELRQTVSAGDRILIDDGKVSLKVLDRDGGSDVICRVNSGGLVTSRKGVNFPGSSLSISALTPKDRQDLTFALQAGVDYVALSFVREAADIEQLKGLIGRKTERRVRVIAKIEKYEAIRNIKSIIRAADAVMVARGDLGVEIAPERVPYWQKEIIRQAMAQAKPVITATQMLESMIGSPTPTRAEASDVANAVYDGTDAIMLSGETAIGRFPVRAVQTMNRIARTVEGSLERGNGACRATGGSVTRAISAAACELAASISARAIVTPSSSGTTALEVAKHRPRAPVLSVSSDSDVVNQLALVWGVTPHLIDPARDTDDMFAKAIAVAGQSSHVRRGGRIVITAGVHVNVPGTTNIIKVHQVEPGEI